MRNVSQLPQYKRIVLRCFYFFRLVWLRRKGAPYSKIVSGEASGLRNVLRNEKKIWLTSWRRAFIAKENSIRATFAHQTDAAAGNFDLFAPKLIMNPVMGKGLVVLEVKYNGFLLDYIKEMPGSLGKSELSVSRYRMARQVSYQTHL